LRDVQAFEIYLNAISRKQDYSATLPTSTFSAEEVAKLYPELVQKQYILEIAHVDKSTLQAKIGIKETWDWELQDENWEKLKKEFPDLGIKSGKTRDDRFAALESLDEKTRERVDTFARQAIVDSNQAWMDQLFKSVEPKRELVKIPLKGGNIFIPGWKNQLELIQLLDKAPLIEESAELSQLTTDQKNFYKVVVIDRAANPEVMTFAEAKANGAIYTLLDKQLEVFYFKNRDKHPDLFQNSDKKWKSFAEAKEKVGELYYQDALKAIQENYAKAKAPEQVPQHMIAEILASVRLYPYVQSILEHIKKDPAAESKFIHQPKMENSDLAIVEANPLNEQWKLNKTSYHSNRSSDNGQINIEEAFSLQPGAWSQVQEKASGDLAFFQLTSRNAQGNDNDLYQKIQKVQNLLSKDVQKLLSDKVIEELKAKNAISLDFSDHTEISEQEDIENS
jgi:hypothetical protein